MTVRWSGVGIGFGLVWLVLAACGSAAQDPVPPTAPATDGTPALDAAWIAPDFTLDALDGGHTPLRALRGQWVILNFWATWCAPCVDEIPVLQAVADDAPGAVAVLGVNMREPREDVAAFVAAHEIRYLVLLDPGDALLADYQVIALPQTLVIDPEGAVVWRSFGPLDPVSFPADLAALMAA